MCRLMLIGLPTPSSMLFELGELDQHRLAVAQLEPGLDAAADHLLRRDAVGFFRVAADEIDPAARDDERLEPIRSQVRQQLELRLVDTFLVKSMESRVTRRIEPGSGQCFQTRHVVMPLWVAATRAASSCSPKPAIVARSFSRIAR